MNRSTLTIQGIDVLIEGTGPDCVVMIHGWPDTHHLWESTVQALKPYCQCVRFTLPGFDLEKPQRPTSLKQMTALLTDIVDRVSPVRPVRLILHDWGCVFGYEYAAVCPDRVARIVGVDVGDYNSDAYRGSLSLKAKVLVLSYQFWLAIAWNVRGATGDAMTRWMSRKAGCPAAASAVGWKMNYPYAMIWFGLLGGFRTAATVAQACPLLFMYGTRKPFMFHSVDWLETLDARRDCAVQSFDTGHWVMAEQPAAFNQYVLHWLVDTHPAECGEPVLGESRRRS